MNLEINAVYGGAALVSYFLGAIPFGWLTAKLTALVAYIVLGHIAVRRARSRQLKIAAWVAALAVLLYIYAVAFTKSPALGIV